MNEVSKFPKMADTMKFVQTKFHEIMNHNFGELSRYPDGTTK